MGIKTYKDENGKIMVKGAPAGAWAIWVLAILVMIINIPITFANPIVGIILFIIMSLFFFMGRKYAEVARGKVAMKALEVEEQLKEQKKFEEKDEQLKEQKEFEEFKKWKEQQTNNQKKMKEESE